MANEIFDDKSFEDLTRDIYNNSNNKREQINKLIREMNKMINTIDDVVLLAPIIKEYLEVGVKNDEHLVKLASVLQRIFAKTHAGIKEDSMMLTESEKEDLISTLQEAVDDMQRESHEMDNIKKHLPVSN